MLFHPSGQLTAFYSLWTCGQSQIFATTEKDLDSRESNLLPINIWTTWQPPNRSDLIRRGCDLFMAASLLLSIKLIFNSKLSSNLLEIELVVMEL